MGKMRVSAVDNDIVNQQDTRSQIKKCLVMRLYIYVYI